MIASFGGKTPRDAGAAFVAANATVLGDVVLGQDSSVWYGAVLRGDEDALVLEEGRTTPWCTATQASRCIWAKM